MTRQQHLEWAKERALEYIRMGDLRNAFMSMQSDLNKHPELQDHAAIELGAQLFFGGMSKSGLRPFAAVI